MKQYNGKNMGQRLALALLAGVMVFTLCSCGKEDTLDEIDNRGLVFGETRTYWDGFVLTGEIKDWDQPVVFEQNGGWGFKNNKTGEIVVEPIYDNYDAFRYGIGRVRGTVNGVYGWYQVDIHGNILDYDNVSNFYAGTAIVEKDSKYGVINTESQLIVPLMYDEIFPSYTYDEETGAEKRSTYGLRDGIWVQLNLAEGYESVYEKVQEAKEYDSTVSLADKQILVVNDMLLVDGKAQANALDFPICALNGVEFDLYNQNEKIGRYDCKLESGLYEGDIMISFDYHYDGAEDKAYFAVPASDNSPVRTVEEINETNQFMAAVRQYLTANGIENTEIQVVKCVAGNFLDDGKTGVLLEIRDCYRNLETGLGTMENWTEKDFQREKKAFLNMILYFPDKENPEDAFALKSQIWQYTHDDHEMTEHIYFLADVDNDGAMEIVIANQYYEYLDYAVSDIYYIQSQPMQRAEE